MQYEERSTGYIFKVTIKGDHDLVLENKHQSITISRDDLKSRFKKVIPLDRHGLPILEYTPQFGLKR